MRGKLHPGMSIVGIGAVTLGLLGVEAFEGASGGQAERPGYVDREGAALRRPRLLLTPTELDELRNRVRDEATFQKHYTATRDEAKTNLLSACLAYMISQQEPEQ